MIPWLAGLAIELPGSYRAAHWAAAWTGLDTLEAAALAATGLLLLRRDDRYRLTAMAAATLLTVDAWFDVMTSAPGSDQTVAIAMALFPELPVAALCAVLAFRRPPPQPPRYRHTRPPVRTVPRQRPPSSRPHPRVRPPSRRPPTRQTSRR